MSGHILIVEDHVFFRNGLRQFLEGEGFQVTEAGDLETAEGMVKANSFSGAIVDIVIPVAEGAPPRHNEDTGLEFAGRLKQHWPGVGVLILSSHPDRGHIFFDWVRDGYRGIGYVLKDGNPEALLAALHQVIDGRVTFDPQVKSERQVAQELLDRLAGDERHWVNQALSCLPTLTTREWEIAHWLTASYDVRAVADRLGLQPKTVENNITQIYGKLGLSVMGQQAPHLRPGYILTKACLIYELQHGAATL